LGSRGADGQAIDSTDKKI